MNSMISFVQYSKKDKNKEIENRLVIARKKMGAKRMGSMKEILVGMKQFYTLITVLVTQIYT